MWGHTFRILQALSITSARQLPRRLHLSTPLPRPMQVQTQRTLMSTASETKQKLEAELEPAYAVYREVLRKKMDFQTQKIPSLNQVTDYLQAVQSERPFMAQVRVMQQYMDFFALLPKQARSKMIPYEPNTLFLRSSLLSILNQPEFKVEDLEAVFSCLSVREKQILLQESVSTFYLSILKKPIYSLPRINISDFTELNSVHLAYKLDKILKDLEKETTLPGLEKIWIELSPYLLADEQRQEAHHLLNLIFYYKEPHLQASETNSYLKESKAQIYKAGKSITAYIKKNCIHNPHFLSNNQKQYLQLEQEFKLLKQSTLNLMEELLQQHPELAQKQPSSQHFSFKQLIERVKKSQHIIDIFYYLEYLGIKEHWLFRNSLLVLSSDQSSNLKPFFADPKVAVLDKEELKNLLFEKLKLAPNLEDYLQMEKLMKAALRSAQPNKSLFWSQATSIQGQESPEPPSFSL